MAKLKYKVGDEVIVVTGENKGKTGAICEITSGDGVPYRVKFTLKIDGKYANFYWYSVRDLQLIPPDYYSVGL
jgi:ribosomal protein S4E